MALYYFKGFMVVALSMLVHTIAGAELYPPPPGPSDGAPPVLLAQGDYVPGEVIVEYKQDVDEFSQGVVVAARQYRQLKRIGKGKRLKLMKLHKGGSVQQMVQQLKDNPYVAHAQPNYIYRALAVPNDTNYDLLWGLSNSGQLVNGTLGSSGADVDAQTAWDHKTDCSDVIVAVTDTGVAYEHLDLAANIWTNTDEADNGIDDDGNGYIDDLRGWDFIDDDNEPLPLNGSETHGTHVAATIGAVGNNGRGVSGLCWNASVMPLRVLSDNGTGTTASVIEGIEYAIDNGAQIINMSLGTTGNDPSLSSAMTSAQANDVVIVAAAGNTNTDNDVAPVYPCSYVQDNIVCVAALDQNYDLSSFSNRGPDSVDVGAPGQNIYSGIPEFTTVISDSMTGWTLAGEWAEVTCNSGTLPLIANPSSYCASGGYSSNLDEVAYKSFDLSGLGVATLNFSIWYDVEDNTDRIELAINDAGGDPFVNGTTLRSFTGASSTEIGFPDGRIAQSVTVDLGDCTTSNCAVGFRLVTNATVNERGVAVGNLQVLSLPANLNTYGFLSGTSMATPHVSGILAMIRSFNPEYTYLDAVNAVKQSGDQIPALSSITSTGRAVDAYRALQYLNPPTGVSAVVAD